MNRIDSKFKELARNNRKALSVFLTAGYPALSSLEQLVPGLAKEGVAMFEIGFPFSDPIADGATIQKSSEISLKNGMNWERMMKSARAIRRKTDVPMVLMSYSNPLFCRGWERSLKEIESAGFDGAVLPDLIPEEGRALTPLFKKSGLSLIYLLAPTSSESRVRAVTEESSGFVYCVSVAGVTGVRRRLPVPEIRKFLSGVRRVSPLPMMLGFGISDPGQAENLSDLTDGFIIGSAMIKALEGDPAGALRRSVRFIKPFLRVCDEEECRGKRTS